MLETVRRIEVPDRFTHELLKRLGFTSSNDRPFIRVLKELQFLDEGGVPTPRYRDYREPARAGAVLAEALRDAYADVFFHDADAQRLSVSDLAGIFQRESGKSERVAQQMALTFKALADQANWTAPAEAAISPPPTAEAAEPEPEPVAESSRPEPPMYTVSLRHDVHVHLPETTNPAVYDAIFRSLREHLL